MKCEKINRCLIISEEEDQEGEKVGGGGGGNVIAPGHVRGGPPLIGRGPPVTSPEGESVR